MLPLATAVLACALLTPGAASAFCVYNNTSSPVWARVPEGDFSLEIAPGDYECCNWSNGDCNPGGSQGSLVTVQLETDRFTCSQSMTAGGYALISSEDRSGLGVPADNYCVTYDANDAPRSDSRRGPRFGSRDVRFLVTGDPQYDNGDHPMNAVSSQTLASMINLLRNDGRVRGIAIAGDLTQSARVYDEFAWYKSAISGWSRFIFDGLGNHDLVQPTVLQQIACSFGDVTCVAPDVLANDIASRKRATVVTNQSGPHYSWDWQDVHFVQLNVFPGNETAPGSPPHSPQNSLSFLQQDLARYVGESGRPVVLIHHYGLDDFSRGIGPDNTTVWWTAEQQAAYWDTIAAYNVAAIFTGHNHLPEGSPSWQVPFLRPAGRTNGPASIPTFVSGGALKGAFVDARLTQDALQVFQRNRIGSPYPGMATVPLRSNLAVGKVATQSSTINGGFPSRAVDGWLTGIFAANSVTHTQQEFQPWWQVDLGSVQQVGTVVVYNRTDCCAERLSNFKLLVSADGASWSEYPYPGTAPQQVLFQVDRAARYVKVQLNGTNVLSLAEVQVFAPVNLALGKTATQSGTSNPLKPTRAVDGDTDGNWSNGSVTQTDSQAQPWWQVDLGSVQNVGTVVVHNRTDCCADLSNFKLLVSADGQVWSEFPYPGVAGRETRFSVAQWIRYVKVQRNGTGTLTLAEVQVFAAPNLARSRPTTQTSTGWWRDSSLAVDGNTDGNINNGSVTLTGVESQPWWQVDLGSVQRLKGVTLYNRTDCCSEQFGNMTLMLSDDGTTWQSFALGQTAAREVTLLVNRTARYVRVRLNNGPGSFSLAEVVVF